MYSTLPKLISFSGRKGSGKTTLAIICKQLGYKEINFADQLKKLILDSLKISHHQYETLTLYDLNELKEMKSVYNLRPSAEFMSKEICVEINIVKEYVNREFNSIREILQIIGSDLIRKYNPKWHINKIKEIINSNPSRFYCIGDCRFKDELDLVKELGGESWFILRPSNLAGISNHRSEIDLQWYHFEDRVIVNNDDTEFYNKWKRYLRAKIDMNSGYFSNRKKHVIELPDSIIKSEKLDAMFRKCNYYNICPYIKAKSSLLFTNDNDNVDKQILKYVEKKDNKIYLYNNIITNPLLIENLKLKIE